MFPWFRSSSSRWNALSQTSPYLVIPWTLRHRPKHLSQKISSTPKVFNTGFMGVRKSNQLQCTACRYLNDYYIGWHVILFLSLTVQLIILKLQLSLCEPTAFVVVKAHSVMNPFEVYGQAVILANTGRLLHFFLSNIFTSLNYEQMLNFFWFWKLTETFCILNTA